MTFKQSLSFTVLAMALSVTAYAQSSAEVRKQAESSMIVTGHIRINADGGVATFDLDRESALPKEVSGLVRTAMLQWRFAPLSAEQGTSAAATMQIRVVAHPRPDGNYDLSVRGAHFGDPDSAGIALPHPLRRPVYPATLGDSNASASVYLLVRIGPDGKVLDASAEQVNLYVAASEREMERMRGEFAESAIFAAKRWRFNLTANGRVDAQKGLAARVPVDFLARGRRYPRYGRWDVYIPGPRMRAPWSDDLDTEGSGVDAFTGDAPQLVGKGPRLLTRLGPG